MRLYRLAFSTIVLLGILGCTDNQQKIEEVNESLESWTEVSNEMANFDTKVTQLKNQWKTYYDQMQVPEEELEGMDFDLKNKLTYYTDQFFELGGRIKKLEVDFGNYMASWQAKASEYYSLKSRLEKKDDIEALDSRIKKMQEEMSTAKKDFEYWQKTYNTIDQELDSQFDNFQEIRKS